MVGLVVILFSMGAAVNTAQASFLDAFKRLIAPQSDSAAPDENTTIAALREALTIGTRNAVQSVAQMDGYFGNEMIKIVLPERIQRVADMAGAIGFQPQVDHLVLTMNRAAEAAAPKAVDLFVAAIREMTFEDARGILEGGDTSATDFFRKKTTTGSMTHSNRWWQRAWSRWGWPRHIETWSRPCHRCRCCRPNSSTSTTM